MMKRLELDNKDTILLIIMIFYFSFFNHIIKEYLTLIIFFNFELRKLINLLKKGIKD